MAIDSPKVVSVPKDWLARGASAVMFPATKQTKSRLIEFEDHAVEIGNSPLAEQGSESDFSLDIRHGRACFVLLSFKKSYEDTQLVRFSLNQFAKRYAGNNSGRYSRDIRKILNEIASCWFKVWNKERTEFKSYRIIERIIVEGKAPRRKDAKAATAPEQQELWLDEVQLSREFCGFLSEIAELGQLRLDVINSISSKIAQAIYVWLAAPASQATDRNPFEITYTNLLRKIDHPAADKSKSLRRKALTQHGKNSVIEQLNGIETLTGVLRCREAETKDGKDHKLLAWVDKAPKKVSSKDGLSRPGVRMRTSPNNKMTQAYLEHHSTEDLEAAFKRLGDLTEYEIDMLKTAGVDMEGSYDCFKLAKALIGEQRFVEIVSEAKGFKLEGVKPVKNETARLIKWLMDEISKP
mgnify:CR=1 FL=1